jgi:beta-N-acetylhexosaminidase
MPVNAFISGCAGHALSERERSFLGEARPWGLILFKRNIDSPDQVRRLVDSFRDIAGRADAPVLIDQEGGRVQRMGPPHWPAYPRAAVLGRLAGDDRATKAELVRLSARLIARDLRDVGIDVDCLPVLDIAVPGSHSVIGDRSYGTDPETVALLGRAAANGLLDEGVLPVIKHIPGHGRVTVDSHHELPVVEADLATLEATDFLPFRRLADMPAAMTAHIVYTALDPAAPATLSPTVIGEVIRKRIGFDGLLLSDDLSMNALAGSLGSRAAAALRAGVDIVLHCNGELDEGEQVAAAAPPLAGRSLERAEAALRRIGHAGAPLDPVDARERLVAALAAVT